MARSGSNNAGGRIGLLLMIVVSAVLLFVMRDAAVERRTTPLLAGDIQAPVADWLSRPFRRVEGTVASVEDSRRAQQENQVLRVELDALRAENAKLKSQQKRLRRLETHLGVRLPGDIPDNRISARAISDPSSPFVRSLIIGAGREAGVKDGYPVMSESGLIGHLVSAGRRSARILRLDDLNSRVAVKSARSGSRAILAGDNTNMPILAFVSETDDWQPGDAVLTSGDDGRMPQGLPVGTVVESNPLRVELNFRAKPVDWVFVVPYDGLADPNDVDSPESDEAMEDADDGSGILSETTETAATELPDEAG